MDMGMSHSMIKKITHQLAGKTEEEKEKIAAQILEKMQTSIKTNQPSDKPRNSGDRCE